MSQGRSQERSQDRSNDRCQLSPSLGDLPILHFQEHTGAQAGPAVLQVWEEGDCGGQSSDLQS